MKLSPMVLISRPLYCSINSGFARSAHSDFAHALVLISSPNLVEPTTSVKTIASVTRSSPAQAVKLGVLVSPRADSTNISKFAAVGGLLHCEHLRGKVQPLLWLCQGNTYSTWTIEKLLALSAQEPHIVIRHWVAVCANKEPHEVDCAINRTALRMR